MHVSKGLISMWFRALHGTDGRSHETYTEPFAQSRRSEQHERGAPYCRVLLADDVELGQPSRSMMVAFAIPPNSHMVCNPNRPPVDSK